MINGLIRALLRPIRIGFLVNPNNTQELLNAITTSSTQWGGSLNPIIPHYHRKPSSWKDDTATPEAIIKGYCNFFDVDFLIDVSEVKQYHPPMFGRDVFPFERFLEGIEHDLGTFGTSIFRILDDFIENELQYVPAQPTEFRLPTLPKKYKAYIATLMGLFPEKANDRLRNHYWTKLDFKEVEVNITNSLSILMENLHFPIQLGLMRGQIREKWLNVPVFLCFDPINTLDLIALWNLRAKGHFVIPIPLPKWNDEEYLNLAITLSLEKNSQLFPERAQGELPFVRTRFVDPSGFSNLFKTTNEIFNGVNEDESAYLRPGTLADLWNQDNPDRATLIHSDQRVFFSEFEDAIRFRAIAPDFCKFSSWPSFANELSLRLWSDEGLLAHAFPPNDENVAKFLASHTQMRDWRISSAGPVFFGSSPETEIYMPKPFAEKVFIEYARSHGYNAQLSDKGLIQSGMLEQLGGGIWGLGLLANKELLTFLDWMSYEGRNRVITEEECIKKLGPISQVLHGRMTSVELLEELIHRNLLRLGLQVQCPYCRRRSWYSVDSLGYTLTCPLCFTKSEMIKVPSASDTDISWAYRSIGPFALPDSASGAYSVLLTVRFLQLSNFSSETTTILSTEFVKNEKMSEIDCAILVKEMDKEIRTVLVENKSYRGFQDDDIKTLAKLAEDFPNPVIVLATLREGIGSNEKKRIKKLAKDLEEIRGRHGRRRGIKPVIILTSLELFSPDGAPLCWRVDGKEITPAAANFQFDIASMCEVSQELHL